jgi:radical SAM protein with 4Fe4S-binding SPASM domain
MKQQTLGNIQIGLREHSPLNPRYLTNFVSRRLRQTFNLDALWTNGWSPPPDMVCAFPTYRCNLHCDFCFQRSENGRLRVDMRHEEMTPEQWEGVIDRVAQFATTMFWMGGEVMIYPRIMDLLARCKRRGLKVIIVTNGYHLAERANALVEMGIDAITVSLDGFKEVHNKIRHSPRAFDQVVAGIEAIVSARGKGALPIITINHALNKDNYRDIAQFFDFARDLNADMLQFLGLMYMSPETARRHQAVMRDEFGLESVHIEVMENGREAEAMDVIWLQQEMNTLRQTAPASPALRFCSLGLEDNLCAHYGSDDNLPLPQQRCTALWRRMVIQPNGDVTMCYNQPEVVVGNVLAEELDAIWNGVKYRQIRQRIKQELLPGCTRCGWLDYK